MPEKHFFSPEFGVILKLKMLVNVFLCFIFPLIHVLVGFSQSKNGAIDDCQWKFTGAGFTVDYGPVIASLTSENRDNPH